jgi:hypothetical protein
MEIKYVSWHYPMKDATWLGSGHENAARLCSVGISLHNRNVKDGHHSNVFLKPNKLFYHPSNDK